MQFSEQHLELSGRQLSKYVVYDRDESSYPGLIAKIFDEEACCETKPDFLKWVGR